MMFYKILALLAFLLLVVPAGIYAILMAYMALSFSGSMGIF